MSSVSVLSNILLSSDKYLEDAENTPNLWFYAYPRALELLTQQGNTC